MTGERNVTWAALFQRKSSTHNATRDSGTDPSESGHGGEGGGRREKEEEDIGIKYDWESFGLLDEIAELLSPSARPLH